MTRQEKNKEQTKEIEKEEKTKIIKNIIKNFIKFTFIIVVLGFLFFAYTTYISTVKVHVREYRVINNKIPDNFNGLKIIHFSDLHYGTTLDNDNIKKIVKQINDREPDIVVFTGDLINKDYNISQKEEEQLIKLLKKINAPLGKYSILGDEDDEELLTTIYNQSEFTTLKNEYDLIYKDQNNPILLVGLSSLITNKQNIEKGYEYFKTESYNSNIYTITLIHEPDSTDDIINSYNTDLLLAGHSHNGTIRIPFLNYPLYRENGAREYNKEYYKVKNTDLYISSGLGTPTGLRLFCRPTISLYRISNK